MCISKGMVEGLSSNLGVKNGYCTTCKITVTDTTTVSLRKRLTRWSEGLPMGAGPSPRNWKRSLYVPGFVDAPCLLCSLPSSHVLTFWLRSRFVALPTRSLCKSFYLVIRLHFGVNCNRLGIVSQTRVRSESSDKWGHHCCFEHLRRGEWIYQEWKRRAC